MAQGKGKNMVSKVKRSFLRMATPFEFGGDEVRFDTSLSLNIPPMIARADAAYERANTILHFNIFSRSYEERIVLYELVEKLLSEASKNYCAAEQIVRAEKKHINMQPVCAYYSFLHSKMRVLLRLLKGMESLDKDEKEFHSIFSSRTMEMLRNADTILSESELNIFHFIIDFLQSADPQFKEFREKLMKAMSKNDLGRYAKSYQEYINIYSGAAPEFNISSPS